MKIDDTFGSSSLSVMTAWYHAHTCRAGMRILLVLILTACGSVVVPAATTSAAVLDTKINVPGAVTSVRLQQVGGQNCAEGNIPVTFAQPFRRHDVPAGQTIRAYLHGEPVPTQTNIRVRNDDGSARHAVITVNVPCDVVRNATAHLVLAARPDAAPVSAQALNIDDVLATDFGASIALEISGKTWTLDARQLLQAVAGTGGCQAAGKLCTPWLSGPLASAWVIGGPLVDRSGTPHPHLAAYFAIRAYGPAPVERVRVDVIVENTWTFVPDPHNITYDATIAVGGEGVYAINNLEHYNHARWHRHFWWGNSGVLYAALNSDYLQASRAVPRYLDVQPTQEYLTNMPEWCPPMNHCGQAGRMRRSTSDGIGPLPQWTAMYVLDTNYHAYRVLLANASALGSYGVHFRNQGTGDPISVPDMPCFRIYESDQTRNCKPTGKPTKRMARCQDQCGSPLGADLAHHPAPAYVAYLVTGDWYYMSELQFWANSLIMIRNPKYRDYAAGIVYGQVRVQAWVLRTVGYAGYILPEQAPLKDYFRQVVINNIKRYNKIYTNNPDANRLGIIINSGAGYRDATGIATWQQSYFMWSVGNLVDLGYLGAKDFRDWLAQFWIGLFTSSDFCWQLASKYSLKIQDTPRSAIYKTFGQVYDASFPSLTGLSCDSKAVQDFVKNATGESYTGLHTMVGHPVSTNGYPAKMQIGMAAVGDSGLPGAEQAWMTFASRSPKPNYAGRPTFAVIPRSLVK